jgi:hypothetical protein
MEELIKKVVTNELIQKPSAGFADKVMNDIFELKISTPSKPLIPSWAWYTIGSIIIAFIVFVFTTNPQPAGKYEINGLQKIDSFFSSLHFPSIDFSLNINLYVVVGISVALMLLTIFDLVLFRKK